jgi:bifunctional UDP-N-acetylglucosamine pyrophosphorylase/glucosamine-1-phosphate N-acetyltransferase
MKSLLPKVLHPICGRPIVFFPIKAALEAGADQVCVVVSPEARQATEQALVPYFEAGRLCFATQTDKPGTGGAAATGLRQLGAEFDSVLVLNGDLPLIRSVDLLPLFAQLRAGAELTFLTFELDDPTGYGRVVRDSSGNVVEIREQKDLQGPGQENIRELNAGTYLARRQALDAALSILSPANAQGEYYLTDVVASVARTGSVVACPGETTAAQGVNDRSQLRAAEDLLTARLRAQHEASGVSVGPDVSLDFGLDLAPDVRLERGVCLRGSVRVGRGTRIDAGSVITDSIIGEDAEIKPYCVVSESRVGDGCSIGPFAHLRPGSDIGQAARVGNYVETKNARLHPGAKANHLAYLGDAEIGEGANLGAGVIICNYDGFMKRRTTVGRFAFIGSDSQLIAPVTVGDEAYVATGTTVTADVPAGALAIGRARQSNKPDSAEPLRQRLAERARREKAELLAKK